MERRTVSKAFRTAGAFLLSLVMAYMLVPAQARAVQSSGTADTSSGSSTTAATTLSSDDYTAIAEAESDGTCASGQALVVYHASGAVKGATGALSIQSDSDPLSSAGFGISQTWDLSGADSSATAASAASDGVLSVQSEQTGSAIASGSDVRIALVERDDLSTADLVSSLESLSFVECAQPNYTYQDETALDDTAGGDTVSDTQAVATSTSASASTVSKEPVSTIATQSLTAQSLITNDTFSSMQWGLSGMGSEIAGSTAGIDYAAALAKDKTTTTTKDSVVVAVMDTGLDYTNPDLADQMWSDPGDIGLGYKGSHGLNGVTGSYDPMPAAGGDHGTHCAGIIAAQTANAEGVASVSGANSHTQLMGLRHESDSGTIVTAADIACYEYLVRARAAGVNVVAVNCSWGVTGASQYDPVLDYAINQAGKAGVLSCFAAGNSSSDAQVDHNVARLESPYLIDVAASNQIGALSVFSCYNTTAVDVAAPGSSILSTFNNSSGDKQFMPLLSYKADKTTPAAGMLYYTDIAALASAITCTLYDTAKKEAFTCDGAVTLGISSDALLDSNALKVSIDYDKIATAGHTPTNVRAILSWTMKNPFKGTTLTDTDPSHYGVGVAVDADGLSGQQRVFAFERLYSGSSNLVTGNPSAYALGVDAVFPGSGVLTSLDTTSDALTAQVGLFCDYRDPTTGGSATTQPSGTWSCLLTGYGIGRITNPNADTATTAMKSAFVPYAFDSGTSMATPMVTGTVAELAALYPNESALQLRGRICGGTTPLSTTDDQAKIASGGRFTFANALDDSKVNANTWSITTSGDQVTVHGYNLDDAKLYVDQSTTAVTPTAQTAGEITFTASSSLLDGKAHRFDVSNTDSGGNTRTYKAAYVTPDSSKESLVRLSDPPTALNASTAKLVSATDRLFYADGQGTYLYSCSDSSDPTSTWTGLVAPGTPWTGEATFNRWHIEYTYADGKLYAFTTDDVPATATVSEQVAVFCNVYDIEADTWSGYECLGLSPSVIVRGLSAGNCNGTVWCFQYALTKTSPSLYSYTCKSGESTFTRREVPYDLKATWDLPQCFMTLGTSLYGLAVSEGNAYGVCLVNYDPSTNKMSLVGDLGFDRSSDRTAVASIQAGVQTMAGNGIVLAGQNTANYGDMQLIGTDTKMTEIGDFGLSSADGLTVGSMAMYDGRLYLDCVDHTSGSNSIGLYTLPSAANSKLESIDVVETAAASDGGAATVSDWRDEASSALTMRAGDSATWTAVAADGYTFAGWYDASGNKVSDEATYTAVATGDQTLTAHFTAAVVSPTPTPTVTGTVTPTPTVTTTPTPTVTGTVTPTPTVTSAAAVSDSDSGSTGTTSGSGSSGVKTGDSTVALVLALLALLAGGMALAIARKRSDC